MDTLPPELLLYFIPFLPLTSLIAARGVNTQWRSFAQTAPLHTTRKVLLTYIHEFDREAYIAGLTSRGCVLLDLFELWILEWPTMAAHFAAWPGLTADLDVNHKYFHDDTNPLDGATPTVETIPVPKEVAVVGHPTCRGLLV